MMENTNENSLFGFFTEFLFITTISIAFSLQLFQQSPQPKHLFLSMFRSPFIAPNGQFDLHTPQFVQKSK